MYIPSEICFYRISQANIKMYLPSEISFSRISQANIVGLSLLYDSIFVTTSGVATLTRNKTYSP